MSVLRYAEVQVSSQFSFLRRAFSAEDLFATDATMGITELAVVDLNSLAEIMRAHDSSKATGVRLIAGCRLDLACGMAVLVFSTDRAADFLLCRLLILGKGRPSKGLMTAADYVAHAESGLWAGAGYL